MDAPQELAVLDVPNGLAWFLEFVHMDYRGLKHEELHQTVCVWTLLCGKVVGSKLLYIWLPLGSGATMLASTSRCGNRPGVCRLTGLVDSFISSSRRWDMVSLV